MATIDDIATIDDVARRAGVTRTTVSHALSGKRPVAAATRSRVLAAVRELSYQPNAVARSLALRRTHTVGLALPVNAHQRALSDGPYFQFVAGITDRLSDHGYKLLCLISQDLEAADLVHIARSGHVDGMLLLEVQRDDPRVAALRAERLPFVIIGRPRDGRGLVRVDADAAEAAAATVRHLYALGHRRMVFLDDLPALGFHYHAVAGFRRARRQLGLPVDSSCLLPYDHAAGLYESLRPLWMMGAGSRPTALITSGDLEALAALHILAEHAVQVPDDLSIASLCDSTLTALARPPITAVRLPAREMTRLAVDLLVDLLAGRWPRRLEHIIPVELVIRGSTAPRHGSPGPSPADRSACDGSVVAGCPGPG